RAFELGERCNDPLIATLSLSGVALGLLQAGRAQEAQPTIERAMRLSKDSGLAGSAVHANILNLAAQIAQRCGRLDEARQLFPAGLTLATALGDDDTAMHIRLNMAELEFHMGSLAQALELARAVEVETRGTRRTRDAISALVNGAAYRIALDDISGARAAAHDALRLGRGEEALAVAIAIQHLATVAALRNDPHRGARLRGYVDAWYRNQGYEREFTEQRTYEILMTALHEKLTAAELGALTAEGSQLSEDQAIAEALAI
ncbi:MAG: hypothetical protein JO113_09155, partial [Candidatus Eremiobacteraeota bacterium]|nr:hypothetical protein [Candidatus Eremiobacteraeota bacterium]